MRRTRTTGIIRAAAGCALIAASLGLVGCSDQYADFGKIDMAASKEAAEKSGLKKFEPRSPKKKPTRRGPIVTDDKPSAPPSRGTIPK
jgi:hypothetical protein